MNGLHGDCHSKVCVVISHSFGFVREGHDEFCVVIFCVVILHNLVLNTMVMMICVARVDQAVDGVDGWCGTYARCGLG